MNMTITLWAIAAVLLATLVVQGLMLRASFQRELAVERARQQQFDSTLREQYAQTKTQIGKLQGELATAKSRIKRPAKDTTAVKQSLERKLDSAGADRPQMPQHGFADTQPQITQYGSLLLL